MALTSPPAPPYPPVPTTPPLASAAYWVNREVIDAPVNDVGVGAWRPLAPVEKVDADSGDARERRG